jgi:hypothetical protein
VPYVVVMCTECLRTFQLPVVEETVEVLEAACRFCASKNRYIIEPSRQGMPQWCA